MRVLAIETSTRIGSVALADQGKILACCSMDAQKGHAQFLLPAIDHMCKQQGWKVDQLDIIACATGPGSFASLRIGISTAKGIAFAAGAKAVGVNTLEALAWSLSFTNMTILPVLDAKKEQVYAAFFKADDHGKMQRTTEDMLLFPEQLAEKIEENTVILGRGAQMYKSVFSSKAGKRVLFTPVQLWYHICGAVAAIGEAKVEDGHNVDPLVPNYIRQPDAVVKKTILERSPYGDSRREID